MKNAQVQTLKKILLFFSMIMTEESASAQDYIIPVKGQAVINVSDKGVNRIAIENDRISQVIGNEEEYIIESDANLGQVFLTSELKASKDISIRLLTEREKIIDVKLMVKQIEPQTIILKYKNDISDNLTNLNLNSNPGTNLEMMQNNQQASMHRNNHEYNDKQQIIEMVKLMHNSRAQGAKITKLNCLKQNLKLKELNLVQATQYISKKHAAIKLVISNQSKKSIQLENKDFSKCMNSTNAVALDNEVLEPKATTNVYLVGQNGK